MCNTYEEIDPIIILGIALRSQTLSFIILILFLIRIPSMSLAILFKDIPPTKSASGTEMADLVMKWKKHYALVCEFVASLNDFIGKPLLIFMPYVFMSFVGQTFYVIHEWLSSTPLPELRFYMFGYTILRNGMCIICLAITSEKISSEVSKISQ